MRPNAPHDPAVEPVEELSDVGSPVVMSLYTGQSAGRGGR
jgi:hypothetical protein